MSKSDHLELSRLISDYFIKYLGEERGLSHETQKSYRDGLLLYLSYIAEQRGVLVSTILPRHLSIDSVLDFLTHLEVRRKNSVRTRNQRLSAVKTFFAFASRHQPRLIVDAARVMLISGKKYKKGTIDYLTDAQVKVILAATCGNDPWALRDHALLTLIYAHGLRVSEACSISADDLWLGAEPTMVIHGKGGRTDIVRLPKECVLAVEAWREARPARIRSSRIFVNRRGEPITRGGIAYILNKYVTKATETMPSIGRKKVTPHVLRHSCAMEALAKTKDPRKVALHLRHADFNSVLHYIHSSADEKMNVLLDLPGTGIERANIKKHVPGILEILKNVGVAIP